MLELVTRSAHRHNGRVVKHQRRKPPPFRNVRMSKTPLKPLLVSVSVSSVGFKALPGTRPPMP